MNLFPPLTEIEKRDAPMLATAFDRVAEARAANRFRRTAAIVLFIAAAVATYAAIDTVFDVLRIQNRSLEGLNERVLALPDADSTKRRDFLDQAQRDLPGLVTGGSSVILAALAIALSVLIGIVQLLTSGRRTDDAYTTEEVHILRMYMRWDTREHRFVLDDRGLQIIDAYFPQKKSRKT